MTKTPEELTKEWKEGKLKQGWYFTSTVKGEVCPNLWFDDEWNDFTVVADNMDDYLTSINAVLDDNKIQSN